MKNKYFKWLGSGLLGVLTLASFSACEDDHFDLKSSTATTTLWENIKENDQLKDFASILEKTHVTRSEYIDQSDLTYAELLDQAQTFTVWAPVDGSYDASALLATLEAGDERTVEKEFIRNHLARYNYPSVTNEIMVPMMNSKMNRYALVDGVTYFKNQSVIGGAEPASNGTLHLLQGAAVFLPNLGDVARGTTNEGLDSLSAYIAADVDTLIFSPESSVPGSTVDGDVQYVDSVWILGSKLSFSSISQLNNEDSLLVAAYPTNEAWLQAIPKVSKFFNYRSNDTEDQASYPYRDGTSPTRYYERFDADSMQYQNTRSTILNQCLFSLYSQPGFDVRNATVESVRKFIDETDYLIMYNGQIWYKPYIASVFEGAEIKEASNGFYFNLANYNYIPCRTWQDTITIETENRSSWEDYGMNQSNATAMTIDVTTSTINDTIKNQELLSGNFVRIYPNGRTGAVAPVFVIRNVLSGHYRVKIVLVPQSYVPLYAYTADPSLPCSFTAQLTYNYSANGTDMTVSSPTIKSSPDSVVVRTLFDDVEIPRSYYGLNYGYLRLTLRAPNERPNQWTRAMYIDRIILEPLDEE